MGVNTYWTSKSIHLLIHFSKCWVIASNVLVIVLQFEDKIRCYHYSLESHCLVGKTSREVFNSLERWQVLESMFTV